MSDNGPDHSHDHGNEQKGGSFITNQSTREHFGDPLIQFIEKNMLQRKNVPLNSQAECETPEKKRSITSVFGVAANPERQDEYCEAIKQIAKTGPINLRMAETDDGPAESGIIFPTKLDMTPELLSGMKKGFEHGVSLKQMDGFFLMHEVHHENVFAKDPTGRSVKDANGFEEYQCDMAAREMYGKALKEGAVTDPNVPDAVRGGRALLAMKNSSKYDANALVGVPGISIKTEQDHKDAMNGIDQVREKVYHEIGKDIVSEDDKLYARYNALQDTMQNAPAGTVDQATLDKFEFKKMSEAEHIAHMKETLSSVNVPDSLKDEHMRNEKSSLKAAQTMAGKIAAADQPELTYQTTRRMESGGEFDGNKYGKAFAREFVRSAETYAPEHFKTDGQKTYTQQASAEFNKYAPAPVAANNAQFQMSA